MIDTAPCDRDCDRRFTAIEMRLAAQDTRWTKVQEDLGTVRVKLAGLEGRIAGYLVAASLLGVCVAFIAAYVFRGG